VDLKRWLEFADELGDMLIIFREFRQDIQSHMEFRGFVYKHQLNAVCQYYDTVYFEKLNNEQHIYKQKILEFFPKIDKLVPLENYIVDFVCFDTGEIKVIELNPWASTTGASLFSWHNDRQLLMNGPFEFRILGKPIEDIKKELFPEIKKLIERANQETADVRPTNCIIL